MKVAKVDSRKSRKKFLDTAREICKNDNIWVCPLDNQIEAVFDPKMNPCFKHGEAEQWILEDNGGKLIGRAATFIDKNLLTLMNNLQGVWAF